MTPRFLVIDDDDGIRRLVSAVLRRQKYQTEEARDGREAIEKLSSHAFDVLFLDLMMPICNGYEVLAFMRGQQIDRKCVVVMTAAGTRGTNELDMTLVNCVLHKPFDIADVLSAAAECYGAGS